MSDYDLQQAIRIAQLETLLKKAQAYHLQFVAVVTHGLGGELRLAEHDYRNANGVMLEQGVDPETGDQIYRTRRPDDAEVPPFSQRDVVTPLDRLRGLVFHGVQRDHEGQRVWALLTDSVTQSTFMVAPGTTIGEGLDRLTAQYRQSQLAVKEVPHDPI